MRLFINQFPITDVNPFIKLETDFTKMRYFFKTELFVEPNTRVIRQGDSGNYSVNDFQIDSTIVQIDCFVNKNQIAKFKRKLVGELIL